MLEAAQYQDNSFLTLTYRDEALPLTQSGMSTLAPEHLRNFLKRLRTSIAPTRLRFYAAGEYGEQTWRPHYHVALFNFPTCIRGRTKRRIGSGAPVPESCCSRCQLVYEKWSYGNVDLGILETASAQYVAGYVTKKLTRFDDARLLGRHPEFSRQSNRPGIGADAMHEVASVLMQFNLDTTEPDVPSALRHGSRTLPLGRYLRRRLRTLIGKEPNVPQEVLNQMAQELLPLQQASLTDADAPSTKWQVLKMNEGRVHQMMARNKIWKQKGSL